MKFISVRDLRLKPAEVWKLAHREKDLVITSNGRPVAILTGVNDDNFEEELDTIRRARTLNALEKLHRESVRKRTDAISDREIDTQVAAVRKQKQP